MSTADGIVARPHSFLTEGALKELYRGALDVMEGCGVVFQHEKALDILSSAGCKVDGKNVVRIPADLVEKAVRRCPASVPVYDRDGRLRMDLREGNVYFGAGLTCPWLIGTDGSRTAYTSEECAKNARIADALENIDFTMAMAHMTDVPPETRDVHEICQVLKNSAKPLIITSHDEAALETIVEVCGIFSGSKEVFLQSPYLMYYTEPVTPLQHTTHSLDKLFKAVDFGLPLLNTPAPMAGATAPITLAGTLVTGFAELLSGMVLVQNYKPGAPIIFGGVFTVLDMRSMTFSYGAPELQLMNAAIAGMARLCRVPSFGTAGTTDAHEIDGQAAFECGNSILMNALSGSNLVHDVGWLASATGTSNELLVLCNEFIGYTKRIMSGIDMNNLKRSIDEIIEVGPGGNFIDRDLTCELFKSEIWYPRFFERNAHAATDNAGGKKHLNSCLTDETEKIFREHRPSEVPEDKLRELERIIKAYDHKKLD